MTIRVDALPVANVVTDANGRFELVDMPAPDFFVHIDGSTATAPAGFAYPNVGKPFHSVPGQSVQISMDGQPFDIYLTPMALGDIQTLDFSGTSTVTFGPSATDTLENMFPSMDPTLWEEMELFIEPFAAIDEFGSPATSATLVPVPADRLPGPLPLDVDTDLVISIQAPGATNFDVPAAVTFPNVDGLPPGQRWFLRCILSGGTYLRDNRPTRHLNPDSHRYILAEGAGSVVDLSSLTSVSTSLDGSANRMEALDQGTILISPNFRDASGVTVSLDAQSTFALQGLTTLRNGALQVRRGTLSFPALVDIDESSLGAYNGGKLTLAGITTYLTTGNKWEAEFDGSELSLPNLQTLSGPASNSDRFEIAAIAGGKINLPLVTAMDLARPGGASLDRGTYFETDGAQSEIRLPSLTTFTSSAGDNSGNRLEVRNGGTFFAPQLTTALRIEIQLEDASTLDVGQLVDLERSELNISGSSLTLPNVTSVDGTSLRVSDGGSLSLPALVRFNYLLEGTFRMLWWSATDTGSSLAIPNLNKFDGPTGHNDFNLQAMGGGTIDLSSLALMESTGGGGDLGNKIIDVLSDGASSSIDLSALAEIRSVPLGGTAFTARNAGAIDVSTLTTFDTGETSFSQESGGTISRP